MDNSSLNQSGRLSGLSAIVTGAGSGIGRAVAGALCARGVSVAVADINEDRARSVAEGLEVAPGSRGPIYLRADVRVEADAQELVRRSVEAFGRVDILVHSAGILRGEGNAPRFLHEISVDEMNSVIDTNLKGTFLTNRAVLPVMINQRSGQIINISSTSGLKGRPFDSVYCASKFGVLGLSESLAEEVMRFGVKVQTVLPDAVDTPLWEQNGPVRAPESSLAPETVAELIVYMLSLPADAMLQNIVISPFKTRRLKKRAPAADGSTGAAQ